MLRRSAPDRHAPDPAHEAALADSADSALLVVLDTLRPSERLAFVVHDVFSVPFEQIGQILSRSPNAAQQLASRARQKEQGTEPAIDAGPARQRAVVDALLAASRHRPDRPHRMLATSETLDALELTLIDA